MSARGPSGASRRTGPGSARTRVERAAGERGLAGVRAQTSGAFQQQHLGTARAVAEEDEDGAPTTSPLIRLDTVARLRHAPASAPPGGDVAAALALARAGAD